MAERHPDLASWAIGELDADEALALEAHLLACDDCRSAADELRGLHRVLEQAAAPFDVPAGPRAASPGDRDTATQAAPSAARVDRGARGRRRRGS